MISGRHQPLPLSTDHAEEGDGGRNGGGTDSSIKHTHTKKRAVSSHDRNEE